MKNFAWFGSAKVSGSSCVCISSGLSLKECVKNFALFGLAKVGNGARCLNDKARQLSDLDPKNERKKIPIPVSTVECKDYAMNDKKGRCSECSLRCLGASIFCLGR